MGATSEHFSNGELACQHCHLNNCKGVLVAALEQFRAACGNVPILVHDAYRCPKHNADVGGVANSQHVLGLAADVSVQGKTARELEFIAATCPLIKGLGRDDFREYVHVDARIIPAKWCYNEQGVPIAYYT